MSADRLRDPMGLLLAAARVDPVLMQAARQVESEIVAARKLVADLRRVHYQKEGKDFDWCNECQIGAYPCLTVALIDEAGL